MVDTNALLSIAFSMIVNFTNIVEVPPNAVPQKPDDLVRCVIGSPSSPIHLILRHHSGTEFWIGHGAIYGYSCPESFFNLQYPASVEQFYGASTVSSNEAVQIAAQTLRQLAKDGDPLAKAAPRIRYPTSPRIPFFEISWLTPIHDGGLERIATVEIDGRDRRIVRLSLFGPAFADLLFEQEIKKKVYTPDPPKPRPALKRFPYPKPTINQVSQAIKDWLLLCDKLGFDPGSQTNFQDINREETYIYTNPVSRTVPACRVRFNNNAFFDSLDGVPFSHFFLESRFGARYMEK